MTNLIPNNVLFSTISNSLSDFMIGAVQAFATNNPGNGWITCDGQEVKRSEYPKLFNKIGTSFGTPSNNTVFKVPAINNNNYFIRGGNNHQLGREQFASIQMYGSMDKQNVFKLEVRSTSGEQNLKTLNEHELINDNIQINDRSRNFYNKYMLGTGVFVQEGTRGTAHYEWDINPNRISEDWTGDLIGGSRPKNITLRYYIFAGL